MYIGNILIIVLEAEGGGFGTDRLSWRWRTLLLIEIRGNRGGRAVDVKNERRGGGDSPPRAVLKTRDKGDSPSS